MNISISEEIRTLWPETALGVLQYEANVELSSPALLEVFEATIADLANQHELAAIAQLPHIASTRKAYKALGKSPTNTATPPRPCCVGL